MREKDYPGAIERFEELAKLDASSTEPLLRFAEALRQGSQPGRAEAVLRTALQDLPSSDRRVWDRWLLVELVDLERSPAEAMDHLPASPAGNVGDPESEYRGDVHWLLERLKADGAIRINCGGGEYVEPGGKVWGQDRFALGGYPTADWGGDVEGTSAAPLYQTERRFPLEEATALSAYAIPLPPATYRIHLHFAEVTKNIKGFRRFDVLLEGEKVLDGFDPMEAGFATAVQEVFEARVDDGLLEVRFVSRPPLRPPKVSAIEVKRVE